MALFIYPAKYVKAIEQTVNDVLCRESPKGLILLMSC